MQSDFCEILRIHWATTFTAKNRLIKETFKSDFSKKINLSFVNECACESVCVPGCRGGFKTGQASRAGSAGGG